MRDERLFSGCALSSAGAVLLALAASLALGLHGCGSNRTAPGPSDDPPGLATVTPRGFPVVFPAFLTPWPELRAAAVAEIDSASPPAGYSVRVHEPIFYQADWGLNVRGWVDLDQHAIHVGFRIPGFEEGPGRPLLPALEYEVANARAGQETGPLPDWVRPRGKR